MPKYAVITIQAAGDKPAEILVHGPIGQSFWADDGITGKDFTDALNQIPKGQKVVIGVNSQGGSVGEGLAIYNAIQRRSEDVTVRIDGYALSIASFFPLAASKVVSPPSSIWMIHNAWSWSQGNANQLRKDAELLDTHDRTLIAAYVAKTGKTEKEIRDAMEEETWFTGAEAIAWGLADEEGENEPEFDTVDFSAANEHTFKNWPSALHAFADWPHALHAIAAFLPRDMVKKFSAHQGGAVNQNQTKCMNRNEIIALLKSWGVTVADNATDEWLKAELAKGKPEAKKDEPKTEPDNVIKLQNRLEETEKKLKAMADKEEDRRKNRIDAVIQKHVASGKIDAEDAEHWKGLAIENESILERLDKMPSGRGGLHVPRATGGEKVSRKAINEKKPGKERLAFIREEFQHLIDAGVPFMPVAANTIDTALTTDTLSNSLITVLQNRLPILAAISLKFETDPIGPTRKIQVPIVTAGGTAQTNATSFEDTTNFVGTIDNVEIDPDRITVGSHLTPAELQTGRALTDFGVIKAHEMADAIMARITAVITTANFASPAFIPSSAANFGSSELGSAWAAIAKSMIKSIMLHQDAYKNFLPATLENFNVLTQGMPGWENFLLNTYWTGATAGTFGFACNPQAIALGAGLPKLSPNFSGTATTVAVPGLGISVSVQEWYATAGKVDWMNMEIMADASPGDTTAGVIIKTP
jgi:ATP-dependent Clp protease protease subunit